MAVACVACSKRESTIPIKAAFSNETVVGELKPRWTATGERRDTPAGSEQRLILYVDAINALADPVYVRLPSLGVSQGSVTDFNGLECALAPRTTAPLIQASVWAAVGDDRPELIAEPFAVPLSERGRAFYRQFLLHQRPSDAAAIDAEIARYAAAPPCVSKE